MRKMRNLTTESKCRAAVKPAAVRMQTTYKERSPSSVALSNLRGLVIIIVVAFHSFSAYLGSVSSVIAPFDHAPYLWQAFPIIDNRRWFGFDIFCAIQDIYLMSLMFFLSALFTWPSLNRKRERRFLRDRFQRLGPPFLFGVIVVMPIALYPAYRVRALDPSIYAYFRQYLALPFWPNGPMWFLWQLLALTVTAGVLHRFAPRWIESLCQWSSSAAFHPGRYFLVLGLVAAFAYVPLALVFTPWSWAARGPFGLQFSRPLLYLVFFIAGLAAGARGFDRGLLAPEGMLVRRWGLWLIGALTASVLWMGLTALSMKENGGPLGLRVMVGVSFAFACTGGCLAALSGCLRFAKTRSRVLDSLSSNAFGIYVLHYPLVVWLQYTLLGVALFAVMKAAIVLCTALVLAWALAVAIGSVAIGASLIGVERSRARFSLTSTAIAASQPTAIAGFHLPILAQNVKPGLEDVIR
jgi:peptidoglycan/LPS O-acetylase OafA/YrhL